MLERFGIWRHAGGAHRRPGRRLAVAAGVAAGMLASTAALAATSPWSDATPEGGSGSGSSARATSPASAGPDGASGGPGSVPGRARPADAGTRDRGDFPDASNTGVPDGVELTPSGAVAVHEDDTVIENLEIVDGEIEVYANNVTIRNVRITNDRAFVQWGIAQREGSSGLVVEDSEIYGNAASDQQFASGISNHGGGTITVRRVEIHTVTDGIMTSQGLLEGNYLHSPRYWEDDHTDMIQSVGGSPSGLPLVIRDNTVINTEGQTAAIFLGTGTDDEPIQNVDIEGNLLAGGGYTIYGGGSVTDGLDPADIVIQGNMFSREVFPDSGFYGPVAHFDLSAPGNVWEKNVWEDGSQVPPP